MIACNDCGCTEGEYHVKGCFQEPCPVCGEPLFCCGHRVAKKNRIKFTKPTLPCSDCGTNTLEGGNYYMVHNEIWNSVAKPDENLCIPCLEKRLGRKLNLNDLPPVPVNFMAVGFERLCSEELPINWMVAIEIYHEESQRRRLA
jgi:hypothetical protein